MNYLYTWKSYVGNWGGGPIDLQKMNHAADVMDGCFDAGQGGDGFREGIGYRNVRVNIKSYSLIKRF